MNIHLNILNLRSQATMHSSLLSIIITFISFGVFIKNIVLKLSSSNLFRLVFVFISIIVLSKLHLSAQQQFSIEKLPFCKTAYDEFSPAYFKDGIVFCSNRKSSFWLAFTDTSEEGMELFDLFYIKSSRDGKKWQTPTPLEPLNTIFQEGPACFFNESKKIVFTRNIFSNKTFGNYLKSGNKLGIYFAELINKEWSNIEPFPYNSAEFNIMHPTITEDGNTLYFASDMPGGIGGFDIYVSKRIHDQWSKPVNLGKNVNTPKDEAFPFIHPSGRLFFASKGWNSRGGFDIFFTQPFKDDWIVPQNMKEPFSSTADDFGLIADKYLQSGYFSSSRNKNDDIFMFKSTITDFENCTQQKENKYCFVFFENGTSEGDVTGTMKYEWDLGDGTKIRGVEVEHCFAKTGIYKIQLNVIDTLTNEILLNQASYDLEVTDYEQPYITAPDAAIVGSTITFDAKKTNLKNVRIARYYWDFGDGTKALGESTNHVFYEEGVYDVKLLVESIPGRSGVQKFCVYKSILIEK